MKIETNGITLNAAIDGKDGAPWLTFSNSLGSNHHMWDAQVAAFGDSYRILRYDTRGHGESDAPDGPYDFDMLIADIIGLWNALNIETSHFVGLSLGGMTGIGLALSHANRVASLAACDCRAETNPGSNAVWQQNIPLVETGGTAAIAEATLERWFNENWSTANAERLNDIRMMILETSDAGYLGCAQAIQTLDYQRRLGELKVPALFIGGAQDVGAPVEVMDAMQAAVPGSQRAIIDPAGHIANIENTRDFNAALAQFLTGI